MRIEETDVADVLVLTPEPFGDDRGLFTLLDDNDFRHLYVPPVFCTASRR